MNKGYKPKEIHTIKALENNRMSLLDLIEEKRSQLNNIPRIYLERPYIRGASDALREIIPIHSLIDLLFIKENYLSLSIKKALGV